jgi:hypothetical protein
MAKLHQPNFQALEQDSFLLLGRISILSKRIKFCIWPTFMLTLILRTLQLFCRLAHSNIWFNNVKYFAFFLIPKMSLPNREYSMQCAGSFNQRMVFNDRFCCGRSVHYPDVGHENSTNQMEIKRFFRYVFVKSRRIQ